MAEYKINYTQSNFTGGIIAAELYGRNDFNKVKTGLKKCTNWTIREAGGLEFRRGTKYLNTIPAGAGNNFKMASLDKQVFFFCSDGIRYLNSSNVWQTLSYPAGVSPDLSKLQFTELKRRLYYYDGTMKMCEIILTAGVPSTQISTFETAPQNCYIAAEVEGTQPSVYVETEHRYTFSLAKSDEEESIRLMPYAWSELDVLSGSRIWQGVSYDDTKFVAISYDGYISTSSDGLTWSTPTQVANLGNHSWNGLAWNGSKFVAIGETGYISTSTNGTTWSSATQNINLGTLDWRCVEWDGTKFVALSYSGRISTSTDGTTWSSAVQSPNLGSQKWRGLAWNGTKFVAIGSEGYVSTSTDGTTWAIATQDTNLGVSLWRGVTWDGSRFVAIGSMGTISYSFDGTTWSKSKQLLQGSVGAPWSNVCYGNNRMVALKSYTNKIAYSAAPGYASVLANVELTEKNSDSDSKGQQVNVTVGISSSQATEYDGGKVFIYKLYQGYFYFLTAIDIEAGQTSYTYEDKGQLSPDVSKTPKVNPGYIEDDGSIAAVNSIADYNQRLFLTRTNNDVTEIIFSAVGNTQSLAYSTQRSENEAGNLELPISHYDSWCKVTSGLDLILSTSYTISKVSGYGDLTTETVLWDGLSKVVDPVRTRRSLIYTNTSNRNIYDLTYNEYGQYDSIDLTLLVKYIFEEKTIKRLAFKDYPVKTIYVLCDDGELYCLTYIKDQNIYAWYKIEHQGTIYDLCVVNIDTEDEVYIVVNYNGTYVLEQAYHRTDNIYLDCAVRKTQADISGNVISGLSALEGKTVRVFDTGNNMYYGDYDIMNPQTVVEGGKVVEIDDVAFDGYTVTSGSITLPNTVELIGDVLVGLPYYAVAETIPLEFADQNGNSTIGRKKAVNEAYLRYGDSRGLTYKTMGHEYDCGVCAKDVADNAQFLERGQVKLHTVSEYKWDSTIKVLQRQPYPARIESITLGITFNDKS